MLNDKIIKRLNQARSESQVIVLVTGVFDLLHQEHINFLEKAKHLGDLLIVGVESDTRVKRLKGSGRPIDSQKKRVAKLQGLDCVDLVFVLPEKFDKPADHLSLAQMIRPTYLAVSSHSPHLSAKQAIMNQVGAQVKVVHQQNPKISTSIIIKNQQS